MAKKEESSKKPAPLKPDEARGKWEKEYLDPKTSDERRKELYGKYGKNHGWASFDQVKGSMGGGTQPAGPSQVEIDQQKASADLAAGNPSTLVGNSAPGLYGSPSSVDAINNLFGEYAGDFMAGGQIASDNLPLTTLPGLTEEQIKSQEGLQGMADELNAGMPQDVQASQVALTDIYNEAKARQEDPEISKLLERLNQQSQVGLSPQELLAMREQSVGGLNQGLEAARRQLAVGNAGTGKAGSLAGSPTLANSYLQARGNVENQIFLDNMKYKQGQQTAYQDLLEGRNNELFNRYANATNSLQAGTAQNQANYWDNRYQANAGAFAGASGNAAHLADINKWNAENQYDRMADILASGLAGAGWGLTQDQIDKSWEYADRGIAAAGAGGGGGEGGGGGSGSSDAYADVLNNFGGSQRRAATGYRAYGA